MRLLLYDRNIKRLYKNWNLIKKASTDSNLELIACDSCDDKLNGASNLILEGKEINRIFIFQNSDGSGDVLAALELKKEERQSDDYRDLVLVGYQKTDHKGAHFISAPNGYLQENHLSQLREILR